MSRSALLVVLALAALRDPCGTDTSQVGVNAACTRTSDCESGLACVGGVCSLPDEGTTPDAGGDANDSGGDGHAAD
ncbi:MAG: hypothetical protein ABSE49_27520 [Polyangiaceae bacterium]